jgi:hypothetical protein
MTLRADSQCLPMFSALTYISNTYLSTCLVVPIEKKANKIHVVLLISEILNRLNNNIQIIASFDEISTFINA